MSTTKGTVGLSILVGAGAGGWFGSQYGIGTGILVGVLTFLLHLLCSD